MKLTHVYSHALKGYAALASASDAAALADEPQVRYVQSDDPLETLEHEGGQIHDATNTKRNGAALNANFDHDGIDDFRVDADIAVLDKGMWDPASIPSIDVVHRVDCVHPDPWRESLGEYTPPDPNDADDPEDPDDTFWLPNVRLNEAGEKAPYGCLENSGEPFADQLSPEGGIHSIGVANRGAAIDGAVPEGPSPGVDPSLGGIAPGARIWSVRVLAREENFGGVVDPNSHPVPVSGAGLGPVATPGLAVDCSERRFEAEHDDRGQPGLAVELSLDAEYAGCTVGSMAATVEMNSCRYDLAVDNAGPPYTGKLGVSCGEAGDAIETEVFFNGKVICTLKVGAQPGVAGLGLSTVGEGDEREVAVDAEVASISYERTGSNCGGKTGLFEDGEVNGQTTLAAANDDDEQRPAYMAGAESQEPLQRSRIQFELEFLPQIGTSHVIAGIDWAVARGSQIDVIEMAIGCGRKGHPLIEAGGGNAACDATVLDEAIEAAIDEGIVMTVAGGNNLSPAEAAVPRSNPDVVPVSLVADDDGKPGGFDNPACGPHPGDVKMDFTAYGPLIDLATAGCGATSGASGRASGAAAALASQCDPDSRADVEFIVDTLMAEGDTGEIEEGGWEDTAGDAWKEPLLNLSDEEVFDPRLIDAETSEKEPVDPEGCQWRSHQAESDVDSDGRADLVAIDAGAGAKTYAGAYEGPAEEPSHDGYAVSGPTASLAGQLDSALTDGVGHYAIDAADVDGDRHADLVTIEPTDGVYVHRGKDGGGFEAGIRSLAGMGSAFDASGSGEQIAVADVDGDKRADLVSQLGSSGYVLTFPGKADGTFGTQVATKLDIDSALTDGEGEFFLDVIDVTGEELDDPEAEPIDYNARHAYADLVTIGSDGVVRVYEGLASGKFATTPAETTGIDPILDDGEGVEPIGLGDVDRDRRADLLVLDGEALELHLGEDDGGFAAPTEPYEGAIDSSLTDGDGADLVGLQDYSRDGLADLVAVDEEGGLLTYLAQRDKTFAAPSAQGALPSVRSDAAGSELVAEKPLLRRAGCDEGGCVWQPPPHPPRFEAEDFTYPLFLQGTALGKFATASSYVSCAKSSVSGQLAASGPALDLSAERTECTATAFKLAATVEMHSCRYAVALENSAGPSHATTLAVACEEAGDTIDYKIYKNGVLNSTMKVGAQQGVTGLTAATTGSGAERGIALGGEASGIEYEFISGGTAENRSDGKLSGNGTLLGKNGGGTATGAYIAGEAISMPTPVAAYSFEEGSGSTASDSAGEHDGTVEGATWSPAGKYGYALDFDGTNDLVTVADASDLDLTGAFTLEAWVRPDSVSSPRPVISKYVNPGEGVSGYRLYASSSAAPGKPGGQLAAAGVAANIRSPAEMASSTWTHLALTGDGDTLRLYVDGSLVAAEATVLAKASTAALEIGRLQAASSYFEGLIDEVRIYDEALGQGQIGVDLG